MNVKLLEKFYAYLQAGKATDALALCPDRCTFQLAGKSRLAGKHDKAGFAAKYWGMLNELSGGSFKMEVHDIMATDLHAMVLTTDRLQRDGKTLEYRSVHVWRFENGQPIAWYEYPRDLYAFDAIWT